MKLKVNGEEKDFTVEELTISSLLSASNVENPEMVSVQLNGNFVERDQYDSTILEENQEIDFIYFMGGGQL
ncbi:MAG: sulfur carrier protein ThiS [Fibrobacteria bacterium]|nr:sulfur carrier protein ThiS [Fibrobacteria bacterium]